MGIIYNPKKSSKNRDFEKKKQRFYRVIAKIQVVKKVEKIVKKWVKISKIH
jgi:hypothetical protein